MVVNSAFSAGQVIFEIPTGVVAYTIGRKASYLFGMATLFVSTLLYVASSRFEWGIRRILVRVGPTGAGLHLPDWSGRRMVGRRPRSSRARGTT
ncbi:MAG: hypothetical protein PF636_03930 [Actinomycetota bacterium]|nr:hypothetical protein [Actinomycetota bacterium]